MGGVIYSIIQWGKKEHFCLLNWTVTDICFLHDDSAALFCETERQYKSTDYMHEYEEIKVTKKSRESQIASGQFSSSVWDMTSWARFNHEGHHVCLAHKTPAFSPPLFNPVLLFPIQICFRTQRRVSGSATVSAVTDWSQIKVG